MNELWVCGECQNALFAQYARSLPDACPACGIESENGFRRAELDQ